MQNEAKIKKTYEFTPEQAAIFALPPNKKEILALIAKGYENKEIASILNISYHTVKAHVAVIMKKTKITRRTRLAYIFGTLESKTDFYSPNFSELQ